MTASTALQQQREDPKSGHVNTLTQEQASLLRDFWEAVFSLEKLSNHKNNSKGEAKPNGTSKYNLVRKLKNKETSSESSGTSLAEKYDDTGESLSALQLYSPEEIRQAVWPLTAVDDPDAILLRFLRARKWEVEDAIAMLLSTVKWHIKMNIGEILKLGEDGLEKYFIEKGDNGFLKQFTSGKSYLRGTDLEGRPVW